MNPSIVLKQYVAKDQRYTTQYLQRNLLEPRKILIECLSFVWKAKDPSGHWQSLLLLPRSYLLWIFYSSYLFICQASRIPAGTTGSVAASTAALATAARLLGGTNPALIIGYLASSFDWGIKLNAFWNGHPAHILQHLKRLVWRRDMLWYSCNRRPAHYYELGGPLHININIYQLLKLIGRQLCRVWSKHYNLGVELFSFFSNNTKGSKWDIKLTFCILAAQAYDKPTNTHTTYSWRPESSLFVKNRILRFASSCTARHGHLLKGDIAALQEKKRSFTYSL